VAREAANGKETNMNPNEIYKRRSKEPAGRAQSNLRAVALEQLRRSLKQTQPDGPSPPAAEDRVEAVLRGLKNIAARIAERAARVFPAETLRNDPASVVKAVTAAADRAEQELGAVAGRDRGAVVSGFSALKVYAERRRATLPLVGDPAARR
jgi:hypothetical protein